MIIRQYRLYTYVSISTFYIDISYLSNIMIGSTCYALFIINESMAIPK